MMDVGKQQEIFKEIIADIINVVYIIFIIKRYKVHKLYYT